MTATTVDEVFVPRKKRILKQCHTKLTYVNFHKPRDFLRKMVKNSASRAKKTDNTKNNYNVHCTLTAEGNGAFDRLHKVGKCKVPFTKVVLHETWISRRGLTH